MSVKYSLVVETHELWEDILDRIEKFKRMLCEKLVIDQLPHDLKKYTRSEDACITYYNIALLNNMKFSSSDTIYTNGNIIDCSGYKFIVNAEYAVIISKESSVLLTNIDIYHYNYRM